MGAAVALRDACSLDIRTALTMERLRLWALRLRKKGGRSTTCPPQPTRGQKFAITANNETEFNKGVDGFRHGFLSHPWTNSRCYRHRYANL